MSNNRQRLGKGLEALIPKSVLLAGKTITNLPVSMIKSNPFQPRLSFDTEALAQLSDSIKQHGLAQPILVRRKDDHYELIAGERRFRASLLANLETIPAIIKNMTDQESLQMALIENLQREDLNAIEEANGYVRLVQEFELTHQGLSEIFGKSRSAITNTLRLLNLPAEIQQSVVDGELSEGHARTLLSLDSEEKIMEAFQAIKTHNMNVRDIERYIATAKSKKPGAAKKLPNLTPAIQEWEKALATRYHAPVKIKGKPTRGKIEITYTSAKQLEQLTQILLTVG